MANSFRILGGGVTVPVYPSFEDLPATHTTGQLAFVQGDGDFLTLYVYNEANAEWEEAFQAPQSEDITLRFPSEIDADEDGDIETWLESFNEANDTSFGSLYALLQYLLAHRNLWASYVQNGVVTEMVMVSRKDFGVGHIMVLFGSPSVLYGNGQLSVHIFAAEHPEPGTQTVQVMYGEN